MLCVVCVCLSSCFIRILRNHSNWSLFVPSLISVMAYNAWNSNRNTPNNDQTGGWDGSGGITPLDDGQRSSPPMGVHPPPQAWGQQPPGYPGQFGAPPPGQPPYPGHQGRFGEFQQRVMPAISPEDIVILRECGIESLLYRCKYSAFPFVWIAFQELISNLNSL